MAWWCGRRGGGVWVALAGVVLVVGGAEAAGAPVAESAAAAATPAQPVAPRPVLPLTSDQIAGHMGETVDWFHHLAAMEQLQIAAADSASRDKLHQEALTAVELAFDFGKACAALLDAQSRAAEVAAQACARGKRRSRWGRGKVGAGCGCDSGDACSCGD